MAPMTRIELGNFLVGLFGGALIAALAFLAIASSAP